MGMIPQVVRLNEAQNLYGQMDYAMPDSRNKRQYLQLSKCHICSRMNYYRNTCKYVQNTLIINLTISVLLIALI